MNSLRLSVVLAFFIAFSSCSNDDELVLLEVEAQTVTNLFAPQVGGVDQTGNFTPISGAFTKFDFAAGEITESDTEWDIAFRGTSIIVNGGVSLGTTDEPVRTGNGAAYIATGSLGSVNSIDASLFVQDSNEGYAITDWYAYSGPPTFLISPIAGRVLVIRTRNGRYAKVEILSYYKDAPANPDAFTDEERYYTFDYIYQPNEGIDSF